MPAITSSTDVLPEPDGPYSASARASHDTANSSRKLPCAIETDDVEGRHQASRASRFDTKMAPQASAIDSTSTASALSSWPVSMKE